MATNPNNFDLDDDLAIELNLDDAPSDQARHKEFSHQFADDLIEELKDIMRHQS